MSEHCVRGLGYQGQNLLCSNWNTENMSELDYNGMFEYLYGMKYGEKFNSEDYPKGIPKEEFESPDYGVSSDNKGSDTRIRSV